MSVEDNWVVLDQRRVVIPSLEICSTNCKNWDKHRKCKNFLRDMPCHSFEPIDPGNDIEIVELIPFRQESLGSDTERIETKNKVSEPVDGVDVEVEETEEEAEEDA